MDTNQGYPLVVAQYRIEGHPTRTEHWGFIVMLDASYGEAHELRGNYDTFTYIFERRKKWTSAMELCGGCLVGRVPPNMLSSLPDTLKEVTIIKHDMSFDCQTWIVRAMRILEERGIVFEGMTEKKLRAELAAEKDRDETGHDLIYERIIAGEI